MNGETLDTAVDGGGSSSFSDLYAVVEDGPKMVATRAYRVRKRGCSGGLDMGKYPVFLAQDDVEGDLSMNDLLELVATGDRLESILGGSVDDAIAAITVGECDDILDAVLHAERERADRSSVVSAIAERSDYLRTRTDPADETSIAVDDVVTG